MKVAVVGAGVAGLGCARRLLDVGHDVVVLERADVSGGRVATLRTEIGGFDHGAQYLTARNAGFTAELARWQAAGVVAPWAVVAHAIGAAAGGPRVQPSSGGHTTRWVGVPGMSAIPSHLAAGLEIRYGTAIAAIEPSRGRSSHWSLRGPDDGVPPVEADAVVIAVPVEPAVRLLAASPALARRAEAARIAPCWALMAGFPEPIAADAIGDAAFVDLGRLAWIARESSKPGRRVGERWTMHAQSGWSVEHFDDDPEDVKAKLLRAFHEATGTAEQPLYATAWRWRHALAKSFLDCDFLWDAKAKIGACGDWCRGYRIEDAWSSGVAMAAAVGGV